MKIGRFQKGERVFFGVVLDSEVIEIPEAYSPDRIPSYEEVHELKSLKILAPVWPTKIIGVGLNYKEHAKELGLSLPKEPLFFFKPPSAVIGPEEIIYLPPESKEVHYEGELAVVIGKKLYRPKSYEEVEKAIFGYTCFNDVTARDLQKKDFQWSRCKSFDTFAPLGPFIETNLNPLNLKIETYVNGELKQISSTSELLFNPYELVKFIAHIMTLYPGDIIATGTPPGVGALKDGDVVEIKIEGIGILRNYVKNYSER